MTTILITGGLGAVGAPLAQELQRRGHSVWVCDLPHSEGPNYIRCDVSDFRQLQRVFERIDFELVYHLAAEFGRWNGEDYYEKVWLSNAIGTKNILRAQEQRRFRMVFTSSSEVYGDWGDIMTEDVLMKYPIRQMNDYAISKWVNEMQIMNSADRFGTETVRVRLFNTYGPGEYYSEYRSVVCQFVYRALHNLPYTVYLDHHRTSSYIDDTVRTMANIAEPERFKSGEAYNIAGDEYHDIKSLSDMILNCLGKDDRHVSYVPLEAHNTRDKKADTSKAVRDLDHHSTVPLSVGIQYTINWQKEVYHCDIDNRGRSGPWGLPKSHALARLYHRQPVLARSQRPQYGGGQRLYALLGRCVCGARRQEHGPQHHAHGRADRGHACPTGNRIAQRPQYVAIRPPPALYLCRRPV